MLRRTILTALVGLSTLAAHAKDVPVYIGVFNKIAVSGYDTVAYFTKGKPVRGDAKFSANHAGVTWYFVSAENRDKFAASPEKYAPQYGGYCAYAVSEDRTASGDPLCWKIVNNKLYLNYDADTQKKWEVNFAERIQQADKNWPSVLGK